MGLSWQVRTAANAAITALLLILVLLIGAKADGRIGASWGVTFIPAWLLHAVHICYVLAWVFQDSFARDVEYDSGMRVSETSVYADDANVPAMMYVPDLGVSPVYASQARHVARETRQVSLFPRVSLGLYIATLLLGPLALLAFSVLVAVTLDSGSVSPLVAVVPLAVWLGLLLTSVTLRPLWRHGQSPMR